MLDRPRRIDVSYSEGPFRYLTTTGNSSPQPDGGCVIDFYVDFEFRSRMLQKIIEVLFNEAVRAWSAPSRRARASSTATCQAPR